MSRGATPLSTVSHAQFVGCPRCAARLMFSRLQPPRIDACGFESYSLDCPECDAALAGVIDPADEALLLSVVER